MSARKPQPESPAMIKSGIEARRKAAREEGGAIYTERREEIVRAAAHVFRDRGYEAATLTDVAKALGADRASLYYYVSSKEELLQEIVGEALNRAAQTADAVNRSDASTPDKLRVLIESMVNAYAENYPHISVYMGDLGRIARQDSEWSADILAHNRDYESLVHSILDKGRQDGTLRSDVPLELCALALFGMINWMYQWYRPGIGWSAPQIAAAITEVFLHGYRAP